MGQSNVKTPFSRRSIRPSGQAGVTGVSGVGAIGGVLGGPGGALGSVVDLLNQEDLLDQPVSPVGGQVQNVTALPVGSEIALALNTTMDAINAAIARADTIQLDDLIARARQRASQLRLGGGLMTPGAEAVLAANRALADRLDMFAAELTARRPRTTNTTLWIAGIAGAMLLVGGIAYMSSRSREAKASAAAPSGSRSRRSRTRSRR